VAQRRLQKVVVVPWTAESMFDLVADVPRYPEFVPGCVGSSVLAEGPGVVRARLDIARGPVRTSFTTRNRLERPRRLSMELVEGLPRRLEGAWTFVPEESGGTRVGLDLRFEIAPSLHAWIIEILIRETMLGLVDAFVRRAETLYGTAADRRGGS
jgi:ribosome-associated toxin RatA of RatAB toxin-antitoxin module